MKAKLQPCLALKLALPQIVLAASAGGFPAQAQCFCLAHTVTGQVVHYGCEARQIPNRTSEWVSCLDEARTGRQAITDPSAFTRILESEGVCNPCAPPADSSVPEIPRQPDGPGPAEGADKPDG